MHMMRALLGIVLIGALAGCEMGYELHGEVVPQAGVDRTRQLLVLMPMERAADLDSLRIDGSTWMLTSVDQIGTNPWPVPFSYGQIGCPEKIQVIAVAPKQPIELPASLYPTNTPIPLMAGDYVVRSELLSTSSGCGYRSESQHVTLELTADEWVP
jgi:hypothetical protein